MKVERLLFRDTLGSYFDYRRRSALAEAVSFDGHVFGMFYDNPLTGFRSDLMRDAFEVLSPAEVRALGSSQEIWVRCQVRPYDQVGEQMCWGYFVGWADWLEQRGEEAAVYWQCGRWKPASLVQDICKPKSYEEVLKLIRVNPRAVQVYPDGEDEGRGRDFLSWVGPRASWFPPYKSKKKS